MTKQADQVCTNCKSQLTPAIVYNINLDVLKAEPGYECHRCYAIYDMHGTRLDTPDPDDGPFDNGTSPVDDDSED